MRWLSLAWRITNHSPWPEGTGGVVRKIDFPFANIDSKESLIKCLRKHNIRNKGHFFEEMNVLCFATNRETVLKGDLYPSQDIFAKVLEKWRRSTWKLQSCLRCWQKSHRRHSITPKLKRWITALQSLCLKRGVDICTCFASKTPKYS